MRKLLFLFLLIIISALASSAETTRTVNWKKIYGWKIPEIQPYIDISTVKHEIRDGHDYAVGMVLFYRQYPVEVTVDGNKYTVTSLARYYVIDCDTRFMATAADFYLDPERLPTISDKPLVAVDYRESKDAPQEIAKEHPLYKTLCPVYI